MPGLDPGIHLLRKTLLKIGGWPGQALLDSHISESTQDEWVKRRSSYAGLTRVSITLQKTLAKKMDCRLKPGNDDGDVCIQ